MPRPARGAEVAHADDEVPQQRPSQLGQERVRRAARGALRRVRALSHEAQVKHVSRADVVRGCAVEPVWKSKLLRHTPSTPNALVDFHTGYNNAASYKTAAPAASNARSAGIPGGSGRRPPNASRTCAWKVGACVPVCGNSTPSSRHSYGDNIASMAWGGRYLISTQVRAGQQLRRRDGALVEVHE